MKPEYFTFAKPLKEIEGLTHRKIADKINDHFNLNARDRLNVGDVRKLLSGVRSAIEDGRHYRQIGRILDETFGVIEGTSINNLLETSDIQKNSDDFGNPPHTPSLLNGDET